MLFSCVCSSFSSYFAILVEVRQKKEIRRSWGNFPVLATCRSGASAMNFFHQANRLVANESLIMPDMHNKVPLCNILSVSMWPHFFFRGHPYIWYATVCHDMMQHLNSKQTYTHLYKSPLHCCLTLRSLAKYIVTTGLHKID